jgi:phage gp46-like protein
MLLKEFFNQSIDLGNSLARKNNADPKLDDNLFWYIIDHDKLHKDYFFAIAKELKSKDNQEPEEILKLFMPMVLKGCREYYADKKLHGKLGKTFSKELREELCKRLYEHYKEDISKDNYKLG